MIEGSVDDVSLDNAVGWIFSRKLGQEPIGVVATLHDRVIGEARADIYRADLEQAGLAAGRCGFEIKFSEPISEADKVNVFVRPQGSNLLIPRTNKGDLKDLIAALMPEAAGAGRSRTLLGGLWTDRTDALHILLGRLAVNTCPSAEFPALRSLITDGFVKLDDGSRTELPKGIEVIPKVKDGEEKRKAAASLLLQDVMQAPLVAILKIVFDDYPVIYGFEKLQTSDPAFLQAGHLKQFSSPAECLLLYIGLGEELGRIDYVVDSHELPEFGPSSLSRWTLEGQNEMASGLTRSVQSLELSKTATVIVGPGLIHRAVATSKSPVLRVLCAPKRVSPVQFVKNQEVWLEVSHPSGARARI